MSDDLERQLRERFQRAVLPSAPTSLRSTLEAIVQTPAERVVRRDRRRTWGLMAVAAAVTAGGLLLVTGGGLPTFETALVPTPTPRPSASSPVASANPNATPTASPSLPSSPASASLPVTGSAREIGMRVQVAPGSGGTLFVSIPRLDGSVVALLDSSGRPRPGWPIAVSASTECGLLLPVDDGSVRVVCTMENPDGNQFAPVGAFAFDPSGTLLGGWPVAIEGDTFSFSGRMVGDRLTLFTERSLSDVVEPGKPTSDGGLVTVAADGGLVSGTRVPDLAGSGAVGPDGVAYGVTGDDASKIWAADLSGMRTGWPVTFDGFASGPAFGPGDRVAVIVGSPTNGTSQVLVFDRGGNAIRGRSAAIPIVTVDENWGTTGGCPPWPKPPLVASDGTIFIFSQAESAVFGLDSSLKVMPGWPFGPATPLVLRDERYVKEDAYCPSIAIPAVGPDSTLYLPLQARDATVGGSLVAVGTDGLMRPGWPVELTRPGAEFWSVAVGSDGTTYALAIEPESTSTSAASILAIAPDGTVIYTTTIVEP